MLRPPLLRTLVTAPSSKAPLRVAASRRASPLQSGAVALDEQRGRKNLGAQSVWVSHRSFADVCFERDGRHNESSVPWGVT